MKVYIGSYTSRCTCNIHRNYMDRKYGYVWGENETRTEIFLEHVEDKIQDLYNATINKYLDARKRKIHVKVDPWDAWSADHTLSMIILPVLQNLKENKHGGPSVDDDDVPDRLKRAAAAPLTQKDIDQGNIDDFYFDRWDYVLDQMIWSFDTIKRDEGPLYDQTMHRDHENQIQNGLRLFAKYYRGLWN